MFWGLIMEPNKRYTQTVEKPFHISQAAMDTSTGDNEICQVMVVVDGKNFLVCTLQKNKSIQVPLDLYFKTGNVVSFLTNGKCNVHLTGYLDPEFEDEESEGEEEEDEEDEAPELVPVKGKRKHDAASEENSAKKLKQETKKQLKKQLEVSQDSDDDEDDKEEDDDDDSSSSDDGDDDLQKLLSGDVDSDENDDSFRPNSTGADSDEESDEEAGSESGLNTTTEADTSQDEPKKLSKSQRRRLKKQQQKKETGGQPQVNGVDKKKEKEQPQKKEKDQPQQKKGKEADSKPTPDKREKKQLSGGVFIEDLKVGSGPVAKPGKEVEVYYEGRLKQNNKMFDNCNKGPGFRFRVGHKEVIAGWDVGVAGMKVGGKRKIMCPPAMAYGTKGSPPVIPPNSTLVFEVELKKVK